MIMGNGFQEGKTLLFDHLHRQSAKSEGLKTYPETVINTHEDFTHQIMGSSAAKVEIVYGRHVQKRILKIMKCSLLPLWDRFKGIFLALVHECNFHNADKEFRFRKVILFATHPQRFFTESKGSTIAVRQDLMIEVARCLGALEADFDPEYYQAQNWRSKVPSVYELANLKAEKMTKCVTDDVTNDVTNDETNNDTKEETDGMTEFLSLQDAEDGVLAVKPERPDILRSRVGEWYQYFEKFPHSNATTRQLLPAAIEATMLAISKNSTDWHYPSQFPRRVREWFKGQRDVLFYYGTVSSSADIEIAFKKCSELQQNYASQQQENQQRKDYQLRDMLLQLMLMQEKKLDSVTRLHEELVFNRLDGSTVETICPCGDYMTIDTDPRFSCAQPGAYVVKVRRGCRKPECNAKRRSQQQPMKPVSKQLQSVKDDKFSVRATRPNPTKGLYHAVLRLPAIDPSCPTVVNLWCCRCKEKSKLQSQKANYQDNTYVDNNARWTLGTSRPLYVPRTVRCDRCPRGGRLIPVDVSIPFISPQQLTQFVSWFGNYDHAIVAALLDDWPSCSREPRVREETGDDVED
jgi:hypothetical protein